MKGYEGVPELLRDLNAAGVRTGVVTSKRRPPAEWAIRLCKLEIPLLVGHEDVPAHKPDPRPLLRGLELLGAKVEEAVYVGDAAVDVIAARVPAHKPDPRPLLRGLELLGAKVEEAVYVGDAAVDVIAARNAGLPAIAVTWGAGVRADIEATDPLAICDTAAELRAVLLG